MLEFTEICLFFKHQLLTKHREAAKVEIWASTSPWNLGKLHLWRRIVQYYPEKLLKGTCVQIVLMHFVCRETKKETEQNLKCTRNIKHTKFMDSVLFVQLRFNRFFRCDVILLVCSSQTFEQLVFSLPSVSPFSSWSFSVHKPIRRPGRHVGVMRSNSECMNTFKPALALISQDRLLDKTVQFLLCSLFIENPIFLMSSLRF